MTDHGDAARRRELQRRAFAPGGALTVEEAEELRTLSAPVSGQEPPLITPEPAADAAPPDAAETTAAETTAAETTAAETTAESDTLTASDTHAPSHVHTASDTPTASEPEATPASIAAPARRPRRALAVLLTVAALILGVGAGWLSSPQTVHATPAMTAGQQKIDAEIVASGDFDAESVRFRGEKDGAALWSATQDEQPCVILSVEGERRIGCASPSEVDNGTSFALAQLQIRDGDKSTSFSGYLVQTLSGEWVPVLDSIQITGSDWQAQYTPAELELIDILDRAGLQGSELQILGYDGDIPVWSTYGPERCLAVVDPDTSAVQKQCSDAAPGSAAEITLNDRTYQMAWSDQRGPTLTILKQATSSQVTCDTETGDCTWVDDTPVDVG